QSEKVCNHHMLENRFANNTLDGLHNETLQARLNQVEAEPHRKFRAILLWLTLQTSERAAQETVALHAISMGRES
ncbi:MAG: hypothetical protein AAB265_08770, partial [candidate division NC10 bacterium]